MQTKRRVLIVDDDATTRITLASYFEKEGYCVYEARDGDEMWAAFEQYAIDLVLLDIRLPGEDGLSLLKDIRKNSQIGIIMVTGKSDEVDRIVALEMGADDYVVKPFNSRELLARSKNLINRTTAQVHVSKADSVRRFSGWTLYVDKRRLESSSGENIHLTRGEFEILNAMVTKKGHVLSRDNLLDYISHREWDPSDRTIDVLIGRIRRKIEDDPQNPALIQTVHGIGYVFTS